MRFLVGPWERTFCDLLMKTVRSVMIVSPFITRAATRSFCAVLRDNRLSCQVITRWNPKDFRSGVSELSALQELLNAGATVKTLKGLHAKTYVFDESLAVVTSANFTYGGLRNPHEWGMLSSAQECPEIFVGAKELWESLKRTLDHGPRQRGSSLARIGSFLAIGHDSYFNCLQSIRIWLLPGG